jgi:multimeric flavodoxin WrbA
VCVINDAGSEIVRAANDSDIWILLTPITYGGYSWHLKKLLDRLIVILFSVFIKIKGEVHLRRRNNKKSGVVVFGSADSDNEELEGMFIGLVRHNAINFHDKCIVSTILCNNRSEDMINSKVVEALIQAGIVK